MAQVAYEVQDLTKVYRRAKAAANDRISMTIDAGIVFGVLGPNGAGKTTFVRQLAGLLRPTSGRVCLYGEDVVARPEIVPHRIGYYGQQVAALRAHRFAEILWMTGVLRGLSLQSARQQAAQLMEQFAVTHLAQCITASLSGGERRMAGLLSAFMANRRLLILDEPTNDLDPRRRQILWDYLHERNVTDGATVIVVSHNLPEVENVAHQAALIDGGKLIVTGTMGELKRAVADKLRIELRLRREEPRAIAVLSAIDGAVQLKSGVWVVYSVPSEATSLLQRLLDTLGTDVVDDFRLITPTLDDVYLHYTGRKDA